MPVYDYSQHLLEVARMMELAARTAPKSRGEDYVEIMTITGNTVTDLADDPAGILGVIVTIIDHRGQDVTVAYTGSL